MSENRKVATISFIGFLGIILGFTLIYINWVRISNNLHFITYLMYFFNLFDLLLAVTLFMMAIFVASEGFVSLDSLTDFINLIQGEPPILMGIGIAFLILGAILVIICIVNVLKFDENRGFFSTSFGFILILTIFSCILCIMGFQELVNKRNLVNLEEVIEFCLFYIIEDIPFGFTFDIMGIYVMLGAGNVPLIYVGLTFLANIAIFLFIISIYIAREAPKYSPSYKTTIKKFPETSVPYRFKPFFGEKPLDFPEKPTGPNTFTSGQTIKVYKCPYCQNITITSEAQVICPNCQRILKTP